MSMDLFEKSAEIVFNRELQEDIFFMALRCPEIAEAAGPGQFVMVQVGKGSDPLLRRPFSICGTKGDLLFILYKVVGRGTRVMSLARNGNSMNLLGPLGSGFDYSGAREFLILVAGGMGIAPLLSLGWSLQDPFVLLAGYRSAHEILPLEEMGFMGFDIRIATEDGSYGHKGLVTDLLSIRLTGLSPNSAAVFACGPRGMLKHVAASTREKNIPCQVSLEANMACGLGACQGCAVRATEDQDRNYLHVCSDGPVFQAGELDWGAT